ncbi:MAG: ABC transporter ATP-binding protein [Planctomycetes bacterium]|nr:ABC transporter ATP-binding protein [Planctomycetota bacterium]
MAIVEVKDLSYKYDKTPVIENISFQVNKGTFLAVAGPNGAGKSTLLKLLSSIIAPTMGTIIIDSENIADYKSHQLAKKIAVVRQEFVPVFGFTVLETVMMARTPYFSSGGFESKTDRQIVNDALKATETEQFANRQLAQLSGGERQRVFIARALAQNTPILLLDEPTSYLDLRHQVQIYDLLKMMQVEKGKTIISVTHDINLAGQYCDEVLLISEQTDYIIGPPKNIFSVENLEKTFQVSGFSGKIGTESFFLPLGKFARDNQPPTA